MKRRKRYLQSVNYATGVPDRVTIRHLVVASDAATELKTPAFFENQRSDLQRNLCATITCRKAPRLVQYQWAVAETIIR
jgi:hypothetical protein